MSQSVTLKVKGLHTYQNALSEIPNGSFIDTDNVVNDSEGVVNPRRGFNFYGTEMSARAKQLISYKGRVFRHYGTTLDYDNGAGFTTVDTDISEIEYRIKSAQLNGNLYLTTLNGIRKLSASSVADLPNATYAYAGVPRATDGAASLNYTSGGWFTEDSQVAYRIVWGIKDRNQNLILGAPSGRIIVANSLQFLLVKAFNQLVSELADAVTNQTATNTTAGKFTYDKYANLKLPTYAPIMDLYNGIVTLSHKTSNVLDTETASTVFQNFLAPDLSKYPDSPVGVIIPSTSYLIQLKEQFNAVVTKLNSYFVVGGTPTFTFSPCQTYCGVDLEISIPEGITENHFYQLYRSELKTSTLEGLTLIGTPTNYLDMTPDDELKLVAEFNPTADEILKKKLLYNDKMTTDFRDTGANLYTNSNSGEGALQSNDVPPLAKDVAAFKNSLFYANTQGKHNLNFAVLSGHNLNNKTLTITKGTNSNVYTFMPAVNQITVITPQAVNAGLVTSYFDLYAANNTVCYRIWMGTTPPSSTGVTLKRVLLDSGTTTAATIASRLANLIHLLPEFTATSTTTTVTVTNNDAGYTIAPYALDSYFAFNVTARGTGEHIGTETLSGVLNSTTTVTGLSTTKNLVIGMSVSGSGIAANTVITAISPTSITLSNAATITGTSSLTFKSRFVIASNLTSDSQAIDEVTQSLIRVINQNPDEDIYAYNVSTPTTMPGMIYLEAVDFNTQGFSLSCSADISTKFNPTLPATPGSVVSENYVSPNRLYFSKTQQPECVPALNYLEVGPKDKKILRILPLRDSLFIMTEAGVYRLSGDIPSNFAVYLFDSSAIIKGADSAVVLNNQIYIFSNQGVVSVSDTGVNVLSLPIENLLAPLSQYTNFNSSTFGVSYESDRSYMLFTVKSNSDTVATQCFRFNTFTNSWVSWTVSKTCGIVVPETSRFYLGASDVNWIEQERKSFSRLDYADREFTYIVPVNEFDGANLNLGSVQGITEGDVLVQTQYLTISQFNRLLNQLDLDYNIAANDYHTLSTRPGMSLRTQLLLLAQKLDADPTLNVAAGTFTNAVLAQPDTLIGQQAAYNSITTQLNLNSNVMFHNYPTSNGTVVYESRIGDVIQTTTTLVLDIATPLVPGEIVLYKAITSKVVWGPQHFGDPSMLKNVHESTLLFSTLAFTEGTASFSSDLSPSFRDIPFPAEGTGTWGSSVWGRSVWGGEGSQRPMRTYIPRDKQRCRYITGKFEHATALEKYSLLGISFTMEPISVRGYK